MDLGTVELTYQPNELRPPIDGSEDVTGHVRPLRASGLRYQRYSHAIRDLAQPRLFENRLSWRLLDVALGESGGKLRFGNMNYFDAMDTCEAVAHETAVTHLVNGGEVAPPSWRGLRLRRALGDPFDLGRRAVLLSINTLTIRRDRNSASVVLHNRNAANVATSGGIIGVMPAGVFQPSTVRAGDHMGDFDLWRNIMREYSEEFLGNPEHDGDGPGADYTAEPCVRSTPPAEPGGSGSTAWGSPSARSTCGRDWRRWRSSTPTPSTRSSWIWSRRTTKAPSYGWAAGSRPCTYPSPGE